MNSGAKWKSRRRMLTPAFHFQILDDFMQVFNVQSRILCDLLNTKCSEQRPNYGEFDIFPYILNCTLDVICGKITSSHLFHIFALIVLYTLSI